MIFQAVLWAAAYTLFAAWLLWLAYIVVMGLYRAKLAKRLSTTALVLGAPVIVFAVLLDWLINWTVATVVFREFPARPLELCTARFTRYLSSTDETQRHWALIICTMLLDVFDPNPEGHCK